MCISQYVSAFVSLYGLYILLQWLFLGVYFVNINNTHLPGSLFIIAENTLGDQHKFVTLACFVYHIP